MAAAEINADFTIIQIKTSTSGAKTQAILIRTKPAEVDVTYWKGSAAPAMTGDAYAEAALVHDKTDLFPVTYVYTPP